jgi:hypothetical protein
MEIKGKELRMKPRSAFSLVLTAVLISAVAGRALADPPPDDNDPGQNIFDMKKPGSKLPPAKPAAPQDQPAQPADKPAPAVGQPKAPDQPAAPTPTTGNQQSLHAVPTPSVRADSTKLVNEVYADRLAAAKTAYAKADLAEAILQAAVDEKTDISGKYALFITARDLAIESQDLNLAWRCVDIAARDFKIDAAQEKTNAAIEMLKHPVAENDRRLVALQLTGLADSMVSARRFELMTNLDQLALRVAGGSGERFLVEQIRNISAQYFAAQDASTAATRAEAILKSDPTNGPANATLGKYRCFVVDDWTRGLRMLAAGNDAKLRDAARAELAQTMTAAARLALADQWRDIATNESEPSRRHVLIHAGELYSQARDGLTGLSKLEAQKRLTEIAEDESPQLPQAVDLRKLVDVDRDRVNGTWTLSPIGELMSGTEENCRIAIPYHPPADYDYRIVLTRNSGNDGLNAVCCGTHDRQFAYVLSGWAGSISGIDMVDCQRPDAKNATTLHGHGISSGERHTLVIRVRKHSVQAFLDDAPLMSAYETDFRDLDPCYQYSLPRDDTLGLSTFQSGFTIHSAYLVEINEHGHIVSDEPPPTSPVVATVTYWGGGNDHQPFSISLHADGHGSVGTDETPVWAIHDGQISFRWHDAVDTFKLSKDRRSFTSSDGTDFHGQVTDGSLDAVK